MPILSAWLSTECCGRKNSGFRDEQIHLEVAITFKKKPRPQLAPIVMSQVVSEGVSREVGVRR